MSVANSDRIVPALRAMVSGMRYTVYEKTGHHSWTPAYAEEELRAWLGEQRWEDGKD